MAKGFIDMTRYLQSAKMCLIVILSSEKSKSLHKLGKVCKKTLYFNP